MFGLIPYKTYHNHQTQTPAIRTCSTEVLFVLARNILARDSVYLRKSASAITARIERCLISLCFYLTMLTRIRQLLISTFLEAPENLKPKTLTKPKFGLKLFESQSPSLHRFSFSKGIHFWSLRNILHSYREFGERNFHFPASLPCTQGHIKFS